MLIKQNQIWTQMIKYFKYNDCISIAFVGRGDDGKMFLKNGCIKCTQPENTDKDELKEVCYSSVHTTAIVLAHYNLIRAVWRTNYKYLDTLTPISMAPYKSAVNALELPRSCIKPSICRHLNIEFRLWQADQNTNNKHVNVYTNLYHPLSCVRAELV